MTQRPSGWYDDPEDPDQLRYWDGILWSSAQMPKVKPGLERSTLTTPAPGVGEDRAASGGREQLARSQARGESSQHDAWRAGTPVPAKVRTTPDGEVLASWWQRAGALVIDHLLTSLVGALVAFPWTAAWVREYSAFVSEWGGVGPMPQLPPSVVSPPWQIFVATLVVYAVYEVAMTVWRGQTVGKIAAGIRVRRGSSAGSPGIAVATNRFVVKSVYVIFSAVPPLGALALVFTVVDYLWPLRDPHSRALHDKVGATYVVRTRGAGSRPKP